MKNTHIERERAQIEALLNQVVELNQVCLDLFACWDVSDLVLFGCILFSM